MAFTIKIYEKDEYIYKLLKKRLGSFFPDAYVINPYLDEGSTDERFSEYTSVLYDPKDISKEEVSLHTASPLRLTDDGGVIDCSRLVHSLRQSDESPLFIRPSTGTITAVIPFVYSDVRDRFISDIETELSGSDYNVRLDFTSKLRALWRQSAGNNMTALLEACRSRRFKPEDILKYCNMDDLGFLTPGSCRNNDDVYDFGVARVAALINHAADLAHSKTSFINVLTVMEGFRSADLPELLSGLDKVFILLPARNAGEDLGARELITSLTKTLGRERVSVYYAEDLTVPGELDDSLSLRRQVV